jgi:hypothetical protein
MPQTRLGKQFTRADEKIAAATCRHIGPLRNLSMRDESTHHLLVSRDYRLAEDTWKERRRRTYLHEENATRQYISSIVKILRGSGWEIDRGKLRSFHNPVTGHIIELEPGGCDTSGHFLHHIGAAKCTIR